ncbi:hypothetical protein [Rhizobium redzepovicii]
MSRSSRPCGEREEAVVERRGQWVDIRCLLVQPEGGRNQLAAAEPFFDDEGGRFVNPADDDTGMDATLEFLGTEACHQLVRHDAGERHVE